MPNYNPETLIAYGIVSYNALDPEIVQMLMDGSQAHDVSYDNAILALAKARLTGVEYDETDPESAATALEEHTHGDLDDIYVEEPVVEGELDGVEYRSTWLGGALHFFILESPWISEIRACSPCVPGAHDIHAGDEKHKLLPTEVVHSHTYGYTIPPEWEDHTQHINGESK